MMTTIPLHPVPACDQHCPRDGAPLRARGWLMPGMRQLADLECPQCRRRYYGDLPTGHGLYYPALLDAASGQVRGEDRARWFSDLLGQSYRRRSAQPVALTVETLRSIERPVLLNCLDGWYGHALLKLLNAQFYLDQCPDLDLIVIVPAWLRWLVPDGVAAIWEVDQPLARGTEWNDALAVRLQQLVEPFGRCQLAIAFSHPLPRQVAIERFTRVPRFDRQCWTSQPAPTVTYIWRDDRNWGGLPYRELARAAGRNAVVSRTLRVARELDQLARVQRLARQLRHRIPALDFAIAGISRARGVGGWITDLRTTTIDRAVEQRWCERYARSHVVVGVHGSSMLLPSAHAGATVELLPTARLGNFGQDLLLAPQDLREALFCYRCLPIEATVTQVADVVASIVRDLPDVQLNFEAHFNQQRTVARNPGQHAAEFRRRAGHHRWLRGEVDDGTD